MGIDPKYIQITKWSEHLFREEEQRKQNPFKTSFDIPWRRLVQKQNPSKWLIIILYNPYVTWVFFGHRSTGYYSTH